MNSPAIKALSPETAIARDNILTFAERMVAVGSVVVTSPAHPDLCEHRLAIRDVEAPGFSVIFLSVADGEPITSVMDFDIADARAKRHVVHDDGMGLTLVDVRGRALVQYRIG